jgi:hypothetical protein
MDATLKKNLYFVCCLVVDCGDGEGGTNLSQLN